MTDVLVYVAQQRVGAATTALQAACRATGISARLEQYATGSIFQRLKTRPAQPPPDLVLWFGPYAAHAAAIDGLLQPHQPASFPQGAVHDPDWRWTSVGSSAFGSAGVSSLDELQGVPRLALADPERSETGMALLLATLDRARRVESDVERGWAWWQQRVQRGVSLYEDEAGAQAGVTAKRASHAVTLTADGTGLADLAPLPHALALTASARNVEAARKLMDWFAGQAPPAASLALDVDWATRQYSATRQRWAQSGFTPNTDAT